MRLLFLMFLAHIIDDFVIQTQCLSNLKQREWWVEQCKKKNIDIEQYQNDYKVGLFIHALSWSLMIHLPFILLTSINDIVLLLSIIINTFIHLITDDLKANANVLNLQQDQIIHFTQIIFTFLIFKNIALYV